MSATNTTGREEIVDKLHGALATFRRERDDLYRKKELAAERLRVATEDREHLEKTIRGMQEKLASLKQSVSDQGKLELSKLELQVERLDKETQFQHSELIAKKEKISLLEEKMQEEQTSREADIRAAREAVMGRRNKIACQELKPDHPQEKQVSLVQAELEEVDSVWSKWPRLVESKAASMTMETADLHRSVESIANVIAGYKKHLGDAVVEQEQSSVEMAQ